MRTCTICAHPERPAIDAALVAGTPLRDIAGQKSLSRSALHRHREHLPKALTQAKQAQEIAAASTVLGRVERLISRLETIADKAQRAREWHPAVLALREVKGCVQLLAEITGELEKEKDEVNVNVSINLTQRALFSRMTNAEMENYAVTGQLPAWWPKGENGSGQSN